MAEIPIEALIREAAQARGVDPDLALKIAQKESDLYPKAKNKRSSAYGLFQITDPTWKQYGGTDENRYDLMDNIRIGVDIIASNRDKFLREFKRAPNAGELYTMHVMGASGGPRLLRQDPNALMAEVVSPQVVKANKIPKTQTVGEFIGMLQKKMGSKLDTQMAKRKVKEQTAGTVPMPAAPKETIRETREPVTPISTNRIPAGQRERLQPLAEALEGEDRIGVVTKDVLEKLGPNYQAALAAMTLGDTREDDDDDEESLSEQYAARQEDERRRAEVPRNVIADLDLSYQSPFGEEQPVMMAKGGEVSSEDDDIGASNPIPAKEMMRAFASAQKGKVSAGDIEALMAGLGMDEGMLGVNVSKLSSGDREQLFKGLVAQYGTRIGELGVSGSVMRPIDAPAGMYAGSLSAAYPLGKGSVNAAVNALRTPEGTRVTGYNVGYGGQVGPGELSAGVNIPSDRRSPSAEVMYRVPFAHGGLVHRADGSPPYGEGVPDSGPVTADTRRALSLPQGLSAAELMRMLKGVAGEGVSNLESLARGSVAAVPGVVGDIESFFRSDKERKFATTPEVERQYLPSRMTKPTAQSEGFTEAGTYIDPTIAAKIAKPVAKGTAKAALEGFKSVSPQLESIIQKGAPAAEPMYVVKPTGGTTYPASMVSKIDDYLERVQRGVTDPTTFGVGELKGKDAKKIIDFVKSKGRDYLTKRYGSPQDAMKEAILDGRVTLTGKDAELFPPNLLAQAREGNPVALERFEEIYDRSTGIQGTVVFDNLADPKAKVAKEKEWEKLLKEGALPHEINLNVVGVGRKDLGTGYGSDAETELRKFLSGEKIPPKEASGVMYAARHGEPIYDMDSMYPRLEYLEPDTVVPALVSVVDDLDRMSFPEALVRGMQKTTVFRNDEAAIRRAAQGKSVPVELFQRGIEPIAPIGDFSLVRVKSPFAVRMEGAAMRHSIGDYALDAEYGIGGKKAFESGDTQVFSIRNAQGRPIISMDAEMIEGRPSFDQIRAVFNSEPNAQEKEAIFKAFDAFFPDVEPGKLDIFLPSVRYKHTREGHKLPLNEQTRIDWWQEYTNYLRKQDAN